jgi:acyl-CoA synthetase (AMP-forming)/AMP-acid ligase II
MAAHGPVGVTAVVAGAATTREQIDAAIRGRLPEYMIPTDVFFWKALPLNANGKIDRGRIRHMLEEGAQDEA